MPWSRICVALSFGLFAGTSAGADSVASAGRRLALEGGPASPACAGCHGAQGQGNAAGGFPRLAGLGRAYLVKQLVDMAAGSRPSPVMQSIAKGLDTAAQQAVAVFYASLPAPFDEQKVAASAQADVRPADRGAWLAVRGDWDNDIPACNQCHGPGGVGVGDAFPPLAGQSKAYLAAQLRAWQAGRRPPLPLGLMPAIATRLSAEDIQAVAGYYANLPQTAVITGAKP